MRMDFDDPYETIVEKGRANRGVEEREYLHTIRTPILVTPNLRNVLIIWASALLKP